MPRAARKTKRTHATRSKRSKPSRHADIDTRKNPIKSKFDAGSPVDKYERSHNGHSSVITPGAFVLVQPAGLQVAPEGEPHSLHVMWKAVVRQIHVDDNDDAILLVHWFYSREDMMALAARENIELRKGSWENSFSDVEVILTNHEEYIEADTVEDVVWIFHWNDNKIKNDVQAGDIYYRYTYNVLTKKLKGFKPICPLCRNIYLGEEGQEQRFCDQCDSWIHTKCLEKAKVESSSAEDACQIFLKGQHGEGDYSLKGIDRDGLLATLMTPIVRPKACRIQGNAISVLAVRRTVEHRERMTKEMRAWVRDMAPKVEERRMETFYVCPNPGCKSPM